MTKNRLLIIGKFYQPIKGGIENVTSFQQKIYKKISDIHFIFFSNLKSESKKIILFKFISIFRQPISIKLLFWLFKNIKKYEYIELHAPNPLIMLYLNLYNKNIKLVIHYHSDIVNQKFLNFFIRYIVYKSLSKSHKIICTSNKYSLHSKYLKNFQDKIIVIPPVIDENKFEKIKFNKNQLDENIKLLSVGRFVVYKGFEILIKSISLLPERFNLTLIGDGHLKNKYKFLIKKFNLMKRVKILNEVNDFELGNEINNCNIFILPSINKSEAFGVVLLEALYFGKPLITSNLHDSGVTEVNKDNFSGLYFNKLSHKDLALKILEIEKKIKAGNFKFADLRDYYEKNYSEKVIKLKYFNLYNIDI